MNKYLNAALRGGFYIIKLAFVLNGLEEKFWDGILILY
jgi:hypothetical protein